MRIITDEIIQNEVDINANNITHWVEYPDDDIADCGADVSKSPLVSTPVDCPMCATINGGIVE